MFSDRWRRDGILGSVKHERLWLTPQIFGMSKDCGGRFNDHDGVAMVKFWTWEIEALVRM